MSMKPVVACLLIASLIALTLTVNQALAVPPIPEPTQRQVVVIQGKAQGEGSFAIEQVFEHKELAVRYNDVMAGDGGRLEMMFNKTLTEFKDVEYTFLAEELLDFKEGTLAYAKEVESPSLHGGIGASTQISFEGSSIEEKQTFMLETLNDSYQTFLLNTQSSFEGAWGVSFELSKPCVKKITDTELFQGAFEVEKLISVVEEVIP